MEGHTILDNTSHQNEERLGYKYMTDFTTGFHYIELPKSAYEESRILEQNAIVFMIDGSCSFSYDQYVNRIFFAGEMIFFPKSAIVTGLVLENSKFLYMTFDMPLDIYDRQYIQQQWEIASVISYDFTPLKMNYTIGVFVNSWVYLMKNGGCCPELHELKHKEIFIILRLFYTKEQLAEFFYPIIGKCFDFRNFVLDNYANCNRLNELIELSNMCPNAFMKKFKNEFGVTAYQWMLKQMCQKIIHKASQPRATIKEIMIEIGVDSPTHFNRICKRHFDKTPKELITFHQNEI